MLLTAKNIREEIELGTTLQLHLIFFNYGVVFLAIIYQDFSGIFSSTGNISFVCFGVF